jgi:peptidoglycan-associated lipoprotein
MSKIKYLIGLLAMVLAMSSCTSLYQKAESKYQSAQYNAAIPLFQKYMAEHPEKGAELNYKIGQCYTLSNRVGTAEEFYKKALTATDLKTAQKDSLKFYYAQSLKANKKYKEALKAFEDYSHNSTNFEFQERTKTEIKNLKNIDQILKKESKISINLCEDINSKGSEFSPAIWQDKLVFSSNRRNEQTFETTGNGFHDLYLYELSGDDNCKGKASLFAPNINTDAVHDASATFTPDGNTMIFARSGTGSKKDNETEVSLYVSKQSSQGWSAPVVLQGISRIAESADDRKKNRWDGTPFISPDGKTLYFASNRLGGEGGLDIWKAARSESGAWGLPENMGKEINTTGNEMFPSISEKGEFVFASDGHAGLGGLDIFTFKGGKVENIGVPVNSNADDFGLIYKDDSAGYFVSNREMEGAKGDDDIYQFKLDPAPRVVKYFLQGIAYNIPFDGGAKKILKDASVTLKGKDGKTISTVTSDASGKFRFPLEIALETDFNLNGTKTGFLEGKNTFSSVGKGLDVAKLTKEYTEVIFDTEVTLREDPFREDVAPPEIEILYALDKADITPESEKRLDTFVQFLNVYLKAKPNVVIEMGSHTDERGSRGYNKRLAERRAKSAVDYIVGKGVDASKIVAKGYGEDDLKFKNAGNDEAKHQANRRTTVKVLKK